MINKLLLSFILLTASFFANAQNAKLNGKVINSKNEPISGATVTVEGLAKSIPADVEGRISFNLEIGKK